jgi:tRNA pseudouridine(38-40) synthase
MIIIIIIIININIDIGENWVVFSISGDAFLRGQVRKLVGLTLAITRGWLPEWYLDAALNKTGMAINIL